MSEYAFEVEPHEHMIACLPGKVAGTVLTVERQIYTYRILEYTEPLFYGRHWCYETLSEAVSALAVYLSVEAANEPQDWVRAIDLVDGYRVRRAHVIDGERVITEDEPE